MRNCSPSAIFGGETKNPRGAKGTKPLRLRRLADLAGNYILSRFPNLSMTSQMTSPTGGTVANAFLLGWALAETLGHSRHGTRASRTPPARPIDARRLTISDSEDQKDSFVHLFMIERLVQLHRRLRFEPEDHLAPTTSQVYDLPQKLWSWQIDPNQPFYAAQEVRALLEPWSAQVAAALNAVSAAHMRAFVAGMSLADTFWSWQLRGRQTEREVKQSMWRALLGKSRLEEICHRLKTIELQLPPYVAAVISKNLRSWAIGDDLVYVGGRLSWRENGSSRSPLQPEHEVALQKALKEQIRYWRRMLFGAWEPVTFLSLARRRHIHRISIAVLGGMLVLVVLIYGLAGLLIASVVSVHILPFIGALFSPPKAQIGDWLNFATLLWTIFIALPLPFLLRQTYRFIRDRQQWVNDSLTIHFVAKSTHVPWNKYLRARTLSNGASNQDD